MANLKKCAFLFAVVIFLSAVIPLPAASDKKIDDPDPLRFEAEINNFREWDSKNSFPESPVLFVGSSSIRLWKTRLAFPDYPVVNRGFGGSHISDINHYYSDVIEKYSPLLIVFYAGDNDVASGKPAEQVLEDYKQLTGKIFDDFPKVKFIYLPVKPASSRWKCWSEMKKTNRLIRELSRNNEKMFYVDTASVLLAPNGEPDDSLFLEDRLHLNEKGYKAWNEVLAPYLEKLY